MHSFELSAPENDPKQQQNHIQGQITQKQANFLKNLYPPPYSEVITTQSVTN